MSDTPQPVVSGSRDSAAADPLQTVNSGAPMPGDQTAPTVPPAGGSSAPSGSGASSGPTLVLTPSVGAMVGVYRLEQKLGEGGMGAVWKAFHVRLEKYVALKLLPPEFTRDANLVARFDREMKAVGRISHPNVVTAMDAGEFQGLHYLVMEYIDGDDLTDFVKARGPQPVRTACELVRQAALGLAAAHKLGLIHRDIKPSNLFVTKPRDGAPSVVKILDLGLARVSGDGAAADKAGLTGTGNILGTPDYMAPEQWDGLHNVDARADVYALGCTLFFVLTGRAPYDDGAHVGIWKKMAGHVNEPIPDLRAARRNAKGSGVGIQGPGEEKGDDIPDAVVALYQRLMAKKADERVQTADELAATLLKIVKSLGSGGSGATPGGPRAGATPAAPTPAAPVIPLADIPLADEPDKPARPAATERAAPQAAAPAQPATEAPTKPPMQAIPRAPQAGARPQPASDSAPSRTEPAKAAPKKKRPAATSAATSLDAELDAVLDAIEQAPPPTTRRRPAPRPPRSGLPPYALKLAAGALAAVVLMAGIIIKIRNKDGSVTKIELPEGADAEIIRDGDKSVPGPLPLGPRPTLDLTPPKPLGTWEMGSEPPWFKEGGPVANPYSLKDSPVLPGIVERPRGLPGVRRWNVDTVWPRGLPDVIRSSPDGKWIAVGSSDGHVRIYDAKTLHLQRLLPGASFGYGVGDLSWHPGSQQIAIAADGHVAAFRVVSINGEMVWENPVGEAAWAVAWNHAGTQCAFGGMSRQDGKHWVDIRDASGASVRRFETGGSHRVMAGGVLWCPNDKAIVTRHDDGKLRQTIVETGESEIIDDQGLGGCQVAAMSIDGWLAAGNWKEVWIYGPDWKVARKFPSDARSLAWSPDGKRLLYAETWFTAIRDRTTGEELARTHVRSPVVEWSADGERCIGFHGPLVDHRPITSLWLLDSRLKTLLQAAPGNYLPIWSIDWSPDGTRMASNGWYFGPPRLWNAEGRQLRCWTDPSIGRSGWFGWRPDSRELLMGPSGEPGRPPCILSLTETGPPRRFFESDRTAESHAFTWSVDGQIIAFGGSGGQVTVIDRNGKRVAEMATGGQGPTWVAWCPSTNRIAVAEQGQPLKFCDPAKGWTLRSVAGSPLINGEPIWSPDGKLLSISGNGWFDSEGRVIADRSRPAASAWRPDGRKYVTVESSAGAMEIPLLDATGKPQRQRYTNTYNSSYSWHPSGNVFATGSGFQSTITAWREADLQPHWHAVLLPDGKAATFSAAGELLDGKPEEVDPYLVYYVEREPGKIETLPPAEFRKLLPAPGADNPPAAAKPAEDPIDFAAERKVAERVLQRKGTGIELVDPRGNVIAWDGKTLPNGPFAMRSLTLASSDGNILDDPALDPLAICRGLRSLRLDSPRFTAIRGEPVSEPRQSLSRPSVDRTGIPGDWKSGISSASRASSTGIRQLQRRVISHPLESKP